MNKKVMIFRLSTSSQNRIAKQYIFLTKVVIESFLQRLKGTFSKDNGSRTNTQITFLEIY